MKVKAAVLREFNKPLSIETLELEPPKEKEVRVKYAFCGFCHSDLSIIHGAFGNPLPLVIGHEASGVVEEVGPGVTKVKKGDHVAATWCVPCGHCPQCIRGKGHLCTSSMSLFFEGVLFDGTSRYKDKNGKMVRQNAFVSGFSTHSVIPEEGAIPVRKDFPLDWACTLGCCMPTGWGAVNNDADVKLGESVAIYGVGGVGLNVVRAAFHRNAYPIIAVDIEGSKEDLARKFGATHFINSSKEDPVPKIQELTGGAGADVVFEVIGDPGAQAQALWSSGMAGKLVIVGVNVPLDRTAPLATGLLPLHGKTIIGVCYGSISTHLDIPRLADLALKQDLMLDKLITKKFRLEEINDVIDAMEKRQILGRWVCEFD